MRNYASPAFQHRHYAAIAKVLADAPIDSETKAALITNFISLFVPDNPKFDRQRFRDAAQGEANGKDKR
jgi:hypothetical protein